MQINESSIKAHWLLAPRLVTYVLVYGIVIFWMDYPKFIGFPFFAYSFLTLLIPALMVGRRWLDLRFVFKSVTLFQTVFEIIVISGIVYTTGNINSAYSGLYILSIISATLVNRLAGTLGITSMVSFGYAFIIWYGLRLGGMDGSSSRALEILFSSQDAAFYNIFLHILTFFLIAFVSGFLVEHVRRKDLQLADTSQALHRARLETDDILRHLNSGLLTVDPDGKIVFFNRAAEQILDFHEHEVRGNDFREVFARRMPEFVENLNGVFQSQKHARRGEAKIKRRDETSLHIGISTSLLVDESDSVRGVIAIFSDLTETKLLEEKIRQADRMAAVGELSAAIAHEIRNPLAAISGSVEVLKSELSLTDENGRLLELIVKESSRLNEILADFLLYARNRRPVFNRIEICRLIGDVVAVVRHHPSYKPSISIILETAESFVYIFGDEDQIKQILLNLIVNACQAIDHENGRITLSINSQAENAVILSISDNGPGIPRESRPRIFDPFYSTKKDGTGMGLAIVQRLTENLGIDLEMQSSIDDGTTFFLHFNSIPAASPADGTENPVKTGQSA